MARAYKDPGVGETVRYPIEAGQRGINKTMIPRMVEVVRKDHAKVREYVVEILRPSGCGVKDQMCHTKKIYDYIIKRFYWIEDPVEEETLLWPTRFMREMWEKGTVYADCASVNTCLVALLGSVGIRASFVFGGDGQRDEHGEQVVYHVWSMIDFGKPFYLEPTEYLPAGRAKQFAYMEVVSPWIG